MRQGNTQGKGVIDLLYTNFSMKQQKQKQTETRSVVARHNGGYPI